MQKIYCCLALLLSPLFAFAQADFITRWDLSKAGSGATELNIGVATAGNVSYTWQEVSPGTASGAGTFNGTTLLITGLPSGAMIDLSISPVNFQRIHIDNGINRERLLDVKQWGTTAWTSMENAFWGCKNLNISATDVPNLSNVTNLESMFRACSGLNSPTNINTWNTSNVTNMSSLFFDATAFNQDIGSWNTSKVTDMSSIFDFARAFNQDIGSWNTVAVTNMKRMFRGAMAFNQDLSLWKTGAVTSMETMFLFSSFNQNISSWNTAAVTNMSGMFRATRFFNQDIKLMENLLCNEYGLYVYKCLCI